MYLYGVTSLSERKRRDNLVRLSLVSRTDVEPVTTAEAKKQLEIASSDTTHDDYLDALIAAARELWEHHTSTTIAATSTWDQTFDCLYDRMRLTERPVVSVSSITYYDSSNTQQTLSTDIYSLDSSLGEIRLDPDEIAPDTYSRWDAITIRYTTGAVTPPSAKHAILLQVAHWFENRDMIGPDTQLKTEAFDRLVAMHERSSYP